MYEITKPAIKCKDGFTMSVQDSEHHYCNVGVSSEVGFPSEQEELLMPYVEDKDRPTETVYAYVPNSIIEKVIKKHGGLNDSNR